MKKRTSPISPKAKKRKKWIWIVLAVLFVAFLASPKDKKPDSGSQHEKEVVVSDDSSTEEKDEPEISDRERKLIDISERLASGPAGPAESITTFDIHDEDNGHYQVEYRLFNDTPGYSVVTSQGTFDIVDAKGNPRIYYIPTQEAIDAHSDDEVYFLDVIDDMAEALWPDIDLESFNQCH